jgi:hypothetical protein
MQQHDFDAPNLDTVRKPRGRSRLFLEDDPPMSAEDEPPTSVEYDESVGVMPSDTKRRSSASVVFAFLFLLLAGVGGVLVYYGDQATDLIRTWAQPDSTGKPTAPPEGFAELQQQLKSIATDLAAVRQTLEQQSAANHDQLTRIQEQIAQQSIALQATKQELSQKLSSAPPDKPVPPPDKPAQIPLPKPAQHPAHVSTQDSSKPIQVPPPQSLLPPKQ